MIAGAQLAITTDRRLSKCRLVNMRRRHAQIPCMGTGANPTVFHTISLEAKHYYALSPEELCDLVYSNIKQRRYPLDDRTVVGVWRYGCRRETPRLIKYHVAIARQEPPNVS